MTVPVLVAPLEYAEEHRLRMRAPEGCTIAEIVMLALPLADDVVLGHTIVRLVTSDGAQAVERRYWHLVRPRAGVHVVVRVVPGGGSLKSILSIVVSVAALALGQIWAAPLVGSAFGSALGLTLGAAKSLIALGVTAVGGLLINALVKPPSLNQDKEKPFFAISGWRNQATPDSPVPVVLGEHRYAPPFAAMSYSEVVGDLQYVRALFCFGYGPLDFGAETKEEEAKVLKIGDTEFSKYDELDWELRRGLPDDDPVTLYPQQVIEEAAGVEMRYERPLDDYGEIDEDADYEEKPVSRFSASDAKEAAIIIGFPGGLFDVDEEASPISSKVRFRIRTRLETEVAWRVVSAELSIETKKTVAFYRQERWILSNVAGVPTRGRYEIEVTRLTESNTEGQGSDRTVLVAVQSFRPEYPLNFGAAPLSLLAVRVKATYQLNGALDGVNGVPKRVCLDWNGTAWVSQATRNPASLYRYVLQSEANAFPVADSAIDLDALAEWHEFCADKGLEYNRVHDFDASLQETLAAIAAAGRASPRHDGVKWTVVVDRPSDLVVDHINSRNSRQFTWRRGYIRYPDALRIRFLDETNNYEEAERIVRWPGYVGDIVVTEELDLPGVTNPDQIYLGALRRMYELIYRPDEFSAVQDDAVTRTTTRGDRVRGSWDILSRFQQAARVVAVRGNLLELDSFVDMTEGETYAIHFQTGITEADTVGYGTLRTVATTAGRVKSLRMTGAGESPLGRRQISDGRMMDGTVIHFGPSATISESLIVRETSSGKDGSVTMSLVASAEIIDELLDAAVIPAWNSRVGAEIDVEAPLPAAPRFASVLTGTTGTGDPNGLTVTLAPGAGSTAVILSYEVEHRLSGAGSWTSTGSISEGSASVDIDDYVAANSVQLRARALSSAGEGPWGPTITTRIGGRDPIVDDDGVQIHDDNGVLIVEDA